ncbi:hypothetical protein SAMN05660284_02204 [Formivibrio citricus]|uniref:Uncharacterized protein n=1 Tax=Formivibrio citricus TaxID=83765 RepID=A0A1I5BM00_9NEIS|nr:hypothetical protein [Formivibrio citricus]SFN75629.1 hypothetical protein SAMN05660284_02204 [Formivibrio citricus]
MWRCYDMTEGLLQLDEAVQPDAAPLPYAEYKELPQVWPLPRLVAVAEANEDYRLIRIPPGFISC